MFKGASANYSLWPERARPHRAVPLTFTVGGFAVGLVCTIAAYEVISRARRMQPNDWKNRAALATTCSSATPPSMSARG